MQVSPKTDEEPAFVAIRKAMAAARAGCYPSLASQAREIRETGLLNEPSGHVKASLGPWNMMLKSVAALNT